MQWNYKLTPGDMIALEAKYHLKCLVKLYNRARVADSTGADEDPDGRLHGIAFAELMVYMEDFHMEESVSPVFQLTDLAHMYTMRLKIRLLSVFPDLRTHSQGRGVLLTFDDNIGGALRKACDHDSDLARAAQVVRREMFNRKFSFDGSFKQGSQQYAVPDDVVGCCEHDTGGSKHQASNSGCHYIQHNSSSPDVQQCETCTSCGFLWYSSSQPRLQNTTSTVHCTEDPCCHTQDKPH